MSALGSYIAHIEELQNALTKRNARITELEKRRDIYIDTGMKQERERILAMKKEIINCVIDYGLTPEKYERICNDIDALIKGEK